jgi:hypothetical protein
MPPEARSPLYLCRVRGRSSEVAWVFLSHDWPISRIVICGGNAGFGNPDSFRGIARGADIGVKGWVETAEMLDLDSCETSGL